MKKNLLKKLSISKETICKLNESEKSKIKGGGDTVAFDTLVNFDTLLNAPIDTLLVVPSPADTIK